jgi:DNA-binding LytR/AlgR family response regulator
LDDLALTFDEEYSVNVFNDGGALLSYIEKQHKFDIIFLDILMEEKNGIEVGLAIRDVMQDETTKLIYVSSTKDFVMDLFNVRVTNFLVKPLEKETVQKALEKTLQIIKQDSEIFEFKIGGRTYVVRLLDVLYFESIVKKVRIVTRDETYEFYGSLGFIAEHHFQGFIQIHRSYYVNYKFIASYTNREVTLTNDEIIGIGSERRALVNAMLIEQTKKYLRGE